MLVFAAALTGCRLTHTLLSHHLDLDPCDDMWREKNASMNPASNYGRVEHKIIFELVWDIVPHIVFQGATNEFTRTPVAVAEVNEREPARKEHTARSSRGCCLAPKR